MLISETFIEKEPHGEDTHHDTCLLFVTPTLILGFMSCVCVLQQWGYVLLYLHLSYPTLFLLLDSMFQQHMFTVAAVASVTGYSFLTKPKNGLAMLFALGSLGTVCDMAYGYTIACKSHVDDVSRLDKQLEELDEQQRWQS